MPRIERRRDCCELFQRCGEVFDNLACDDLRWRKIVEILKGLVTQPGEVEVDLVSGDKIVASRRLYRITLATQRYCDGGR
jgi:hypothetical protein